MMGYQIPEIHLQFLISWTSLQSVHEECCEQQHLSRVFEDSIGTLHYPKTKKTACICEDNKMKYNKRWGRIDTIRDHTTEQDSKLSVPRPKVSCLREGPKKLSFMHQPIYNKLTLY